MEDKLIYQLSVDDVQNVADDVLSRSLTEKEIEEVKELVESYINWYDIIEMAILEKIGSWYTLHFKKPFTLFQAL